jgi:molybdate transport system substrate-binding protein
LHGGLPKPDVSSTAALKQALLGARTIAFSTGPSGAVVTAMLAKMGIADTVKAKIRQPPSGVLVGSYIASGEAEIGFQQTNELSHFPGVDYLGPMPAEFQDITARSGGITMVSREREAAQALLRFLTAPEAAPVVRKYGLDPP